MRRRAAVGSLGPGDAGPRPERPRAQPQATNQFGCSPSGIRVSAPRAGRSRRSDNGPVACRAGVGDTGRPCPVECHGSGMNPLRSLCPRTVSAEPRSPRRDSRSARLWAGARPRAGWARNISSRSATPGGLAGAAAAAREPQRWVSCGTCGLGFSVRKRLARASSAGRVCGKVKPVLATG